MFDGLLSGMITARDGQALATWLPARWRVLLGLTGDRLLFQRRDDEIEMTWLDGTRRQMLARLPVTVTSDELQSLLGNRLAGLPRWWLVPAGMALRRRLLVLCARFILRLFELPL